MHKAAIILKDVFNKLSALKTNGTISDIIKTRAYAPQSSPTLLVNMGNDEPILTGSTYHDLKLTINTDIYLQATTPDLDEAALAVRLEIHKIMMQNLNQGLGFVINTEFVGQTQPDHEGDAEEYGSVTRLTWLITYRANLTNPSL